MKTRSVFSVTALLLLAGVACSSFPEREWMQEQAPAIRRGEGNRAIEQIVAGFERVRPSDRELAISTVAAAPEPGSTTALLTLLSKPASTVPVQEKGLIVAELRGREDERIPDAIIAAATAEPELVTENLVRYFDEGRMENAIPLVKRTLEEPRFIDVCLAMLASFDRPDLNEYILALGKRRESPEVRLAALKTASAFESESMVTATTAVFEEIVRNADTEPDPVVKLALEYLGTRPATEERLTILREFYQDSENAELREQAVDALVTMQAVERSTVMSRLNANLDGADVNLAIQNSRTATRREQERTERVVPTARTERTQTRRNTNLRRPTSYPSDYLARLTRRLNSELGSHRGNDRRVRIDNALRSFAGRDNLAMARLVQRSYQKFFPNEDAEAIKRRLEQGVSMPGSLSIIVWNIVDEYDTDPMRVYVISRMFSVARWEAEIILQIVRTNQI